MVKQKRKIRFLNSNTEHLKHNSDFSVENVIAVLQRPSRPSDS